MSSVKRKPRPLTRDKSSFRDDRLFIIACDDTYAPKQYFDFFKIARVQVHVITTQDGTSSARQVLERLKGFDHEEDDERWLLLDTDHYTQGPHQKNFTEAISDAQQQGVNVALSKPCFELWLLLHHEEESAVDALTNANETEKALRTKLGQYNKSNLKQEHYPMGLVAKACERAKRLDQKARGTIPACNTSRVYKVWKAIATKALPSQLPSELKSLVSP